MLFVVDQDNMRKDVGCSNFFVSLNKKSKNVKKISGINSLCSPSLFVLLLFIICSTRFTIIGSCFFTKQHRKSLNLCSGSDVMKNGGTGGKNDLFKRQGNLFEAMNLFTERKENEAHTFQKFKATPLYSKTNNAFLKLTYPKLNACGNAKLQEKIKLYNGLKGKTILKNAIGENKYCEDLYLTKRFPSRTINIGDLKMGSSHRIVKQTMATSDTRNVEATVHQIEKCAAHGADLVRITVQGLREAEATHKIKESLLKRNCNIPLVADIHFTPKIALMVADVVEKIRVNPGNFADGAKKWEEKVFEDESDFLEGRQRAEELFSPLVQKCKRLNRAIRIGTNHGSLSARILSYYGDSPRGMVESAFEFAEICRKNDFHNFCFSMKSSNPVVMVHAYRLLVHEQYKKGWFYPIHLGVTEAGEGEDGRLKSAIGIGALLNDGIGDTIRVSLTEDAWLELSSCSYLANMGHQKEKEISKCNRVRKFNETTRNFFNITKREVILPYQIQGDEWDVRGILHRDGSVISSIEETELLKPDKLFEDLGCRMIMGMPFKDISTSDSVYLKSLRFGENQQENMTKKTTIKQLQDANLGVLLPINDLEKIEKSSQSKMLNNVIAILNAKFLEKQIEEQKNVSDNKDVIIHFQLPRNSIRYALELHGDEDERTLGFIQRLEVPPVMIIMKINDELSHLHASRRIFDFLKKIESKIPVVHQKSYNSSISLEDISLNSGMEIGSLLVDKLGDGVMIEAEGKRGKDIRCMSFALLQASRMRNTKTEFISCPSCGRTLFNIQEVTDQIRKRTGHLVGVSIAVMGCIVNGVGEMADADFGYVGGSPGNVDLYVGKKLVQRGIPNDKACDALIQLIKEHGRWVEPNEKNSTDSTINTKSDSSLVTNT